MSCLDPIEQEIRDVERMLVEEEDSAVEAQEALLAEPTLTALHPESPKRLADGSGLAQSHANIELVSHALVEREAKKSSKLHAKRRGPYRVVNHIGAAHALERLITNKLWDYHTK